MLVNFPRQVLMELAAIREAQARLEETLEKWRLSTSGRLENFVRLSLQNQDASADLIVAIKRKLEDHAISVDATLQEFREKCLYDLGNKITQDREQSFTQNIRREDLSAKDNQPVADELKAQIGSSSESDQGRSR
jgi:hypothetical protein